MNNMRQRLEKTGGDFPASWYPKDGDILVGELLYYTSAPTAHGTMRIAVIRDAESGEDISVWLSRSVLRAEFEKQDPNPGDHVGIKFHGPKVSRKGTTYYGYSVHVERPLTAA